MALRAQLWALSHDIPTPPLPAPGLVSIPADGAMALQWPEGFAQIMGWVPAGPVLLRLDVAERVAGDLGYLTRRAPAPMPPEVLGRFGIRGEQLGAVLAGLGFRLMEAAPLAEDVQGPPAPAMVAWARPERAPRPPRWRGPPRREGAPARAEGEAATGDAAPGPQHGRREFPQGPRPPRREGEQRPRADRPEGQGPGEQTRREGQPPRADRPQEGRRDGPPARDDRPRRDGPPRDRRDRGPKGGPGGPETRTFFEDRPTARAEDSPFAALLKLKLK
jgi:ATP-dependent RNA helicase SUPV3L1/SUV3